MKLKTILLSFLITIAMSLFSVNTNAQIRHRRAEDGAPKTVHVRSYDKKDGTHVNTYNRRSPRH
jgi:hypothetical protein